MAIAPPTSDSSITVAAAAQAGANPRRSRRRRTSHLKDVPGTKELRTDIRLQCRAAAAKLNPELPPTKDEIETVARGVLENMGLPESFLGWTMVLLTTEFWTDQVAAVPPSRRLFLLPHCLKHAEGCPADYDEFGLDCEWSRRRLFGCLDDLQLPCADAK